MDKTKLQAQGILEPSHGAYRTFSPTVAAVAAVILAMFCAFVEYEAGVHTAAQVSQVRGISSSSPSSRSLCWIAYAAGRSTLIEPTTSDIAA